MELYLTQPARKIQFPQGANQPKMLPVPWKVQPVQERKRSRGREKYHVTPTNYKQRKFSENATLAVRRLVPRITSNVLAEKISAF